MGRKKRNRAQLKPFCFYCDREFDDEKVLIQHQKAKHFKCSGCNRKLDTATGLVVHMLQVHKETISKVPNAHTGRENPDVIIHGMTGVPIELLTERQAKHDRERGAAKHSKSAHTTFGMSVMSGFFNQMGGGTGAPVSAAVPAAASPAPAAGMQPLAFTQFMSQMQQSPQAAFTAMFGLPAPKIAGVAGALPAVAPTAGGPQPSFILPGQFGSTAIPTGGAEFKPAPPGGFQPVGFANQPAPGEGKTQPVGEGGVSGSRLPDVLSSALGAKTGRLMLSTPDDSISFEELRAQDQRFSRFISPLSSETTSVVPPV